MPATRRPPKPAPAASERPRRHPLTQEAVAASQRARLLDALGRAVAAKGVAATTVADVIALAGVSRRTFYEQFDRLEDCFVAAYEDGMRRLFAAIRAALADQREAGWRDRTRVAIATYLHALASMPEATRAFTLETLGAGPQAQAQRRRVLAEWVGHWRALQRLREHLDPTTPPLPDAVLVGLVGGLEEMVREQLLNRGARSLPTLAPAATAFALAVLEGAGRPAPGD